MKRADGAAGDTRALPCLRQPQAVARALLCVRVGEGVSNLDELEASAGDGMRHSHCLHWQPQHCRRRRHHHHRCRHRRVCVHRDLRRCLCQCLHQCYRHRYRRLLRPCVPRAAPRAVRHGVAAVPSAGGGRARDRNSTQPQGSEVRDQTRAENKVETE